MNSLEVAIDKIRFYENKFGSPSGDKCYGMGNALKQYLKVPHFFPLYVELDHGVSIIDTPNNCQLKTRYPIFVTRESQKKELSKYGKQAYVTGSTFVHYRKLNKIELSPDAAGTVCFPVHSTHLIDVVFDWEKYSEELLKLPQQLHPITVCVYWSDLLKKRHKPLLDKKINVVTAGHMADPNFTHNFYHILRKHKYGTSNQISSCTFYCVEMGIPFFLYGDEPLFDNFGGDHNRPNGLFNLSHEIEHNPFKFLSLDCVELTQPMKKISYEKLGINDKVDKKELIFAIITSLIVQMPSIIKKNLIDIKKNITKIQNKLLNLLNFYFNNWKTYSYLVINNLCQDNLVFTHLTPHEKVLIHREVKKQQQEKKEPIIAVEIGSFLGASSCFICNAISNNSKLYCIDTWGNHAMKYCEEDNEDERDTYEEFKANTQKYRNRIIEIRKWSTEAIDDLKQSETNIDFLFVDGDHNYEAVKKDWELYSPLLHINSVIAFHDTGWANGVNQVISDFVISRSEKIAELPNIQFFKIIK
jgi:hypothetical protein